MTETERLVLLLTANLVLLTSRPGYATLAQVEVARQRLGDALHALDAEAVRIAGLDTANKSADKRE